MGDQSASHNGQLLIDIASQTVVPSSHVVVSDLIDKTNHRYHRVAMVAAVMCDNAPILKQIVKVDEHNVVQCCGLMATQGNAATPNILRIDQRTNLTMTCMDYDACECFIYLHSITREDYIVVITRAIRYGAQKILAHIALKPEYTEYVISEARKYGLNLRICV